MSYNKYQHLERLGSEEVDGILNGICHIFPKIDGTNSQLWWDEELKAGSRNRELTLESDNAGFFNWAIEQETFSNIFTDYPALKLYGEWLVPHTLKTYNVNAWRKFYVFDVMIDDHYVPYDVYVPLLTMYRIDFIPLIAKIENPDIDALQKMVKENTYLVDSGIGEGIVIKNYDFKNKYGRITWAKIVATEFKETKGFSKKEIEAVETVEQQIVNSFVTEAFVKKELAKIELVESWSSKLIPKLLNTVFHELIQEEMWNILKRFKNPKIDFKSLNALTISKVKEVLIDKF